LLGRKPQLNPGQANWDGGGDSLRFLLTIDIGMTSSESVILLFEIPIVTINTVNVRFALGGFVVCFDDIFDDIVDPVGEY